MKTGVRLFLAFVVSGFLTLTACKSDQQKSISYIGSSTIGEEIIPDAFAVFSKRTSIRIGSIENIGSGKGVEAVIAGQAKLGGASRTLFADERNQGLRQEIIGYDAITVFVHSENPIKNLSSVQLKKIFTGRVRNWKELGGRNSPIIVVTEILGEQRATMLEFQKIVMDDQPYLSDRQEVDRPAEQVSVLQNNDNAIISVSRAFAAPGIKAISVDSVKSTRANIRSHLYPIIRPLILFAKKRKGIERRFLNFMLSSSGQKIVGKHFVSVKSSKEKKDPK